MKKYLLLIQMFGTSKEIRKTYNSYEEYDNNYVRCIHNVEFGYEMFIKIIDDNGIEHYINPKYVAWTELIVQERDKKNE